MERNISVILTLLTLTFSVVAPSVVVSGSRARSTWSSATVGLSLAIDQSTPILPSVSSHLVSSFLPGDISSFTSIIGATSLAPTPPTTRAPVSPSSSGSQARSTSSSVTLRSSLAVDQSTPVFSSVSSHLVSSSLPGDISSFTSIIGATSPAPTPPTTRAQVSPSSSVFFKHGSSGYFSSPNQDGIYIWNITVPSGYIIKISFLHFHLGYRYRGGAWLTITNVSCGTVTLDGWMPPVPVYSVGNSIQVTLQKRRSDNYLQLNASYTAITYESLCPNLLSLSETSGVITSPYYPRKYGNNHTCSWKITATKGNYIVLIFEHSHILACGTACSCDYLEIQTGLSSDGVSSARRCGYIGNVIYHVFHDSLKVLFVSNHTAGRYDGLRFKATYAQVNYTSIPASCFTGESLTGSSGFFSSPNFPNNFPPYSRCTWNITVPTGYIIKINFLHYDMYYCWSGGAQITITNVTSSDGLLCGYHRPAPVYSVGNSIQVTFISRANQYTGFNASFTAITYESLCPNMMTLNETSGVITSPYYPRPYPDNQTCSWQIKVTKGSYIVLTINDMDIQQCGEACTCGYLEIKNGLFSDFASNTRRCGGSSIIHHSYNESLKVLFVSGRAGRHYGFKATYYKVNYTGLPAACISGEFLTGSSGFFSSPNFPNNFPQYSRCTWNITVPSGYIIIVSFHHFDLDIRWWAIGAQLTITNVSSGAITLHGNSLPDPVYSVRNSIQVTFISHDYQYSGFNASYMAITYESLCPKQITLNDTTGVFTSPYYPRQYGYNHACSWKITASKGKWVQLTIEYGNIQKCGANCTCDYLEIQNGYFSNAGPLNGRICGMHFGRTIVYSFNETLKVLFVSDDNDTTRLDSFRAFYAQLSTECITGEFLSGSRGFFSSPYFPNNYPRYSKCTWNITVPSGYIIEVSFQHFELDPHRRGRVTITNVAVGDNKLFGQQLPDPVYSMGNTMQVTFYTDNLEYPGFNASYTAILAKTSPPTNEITVKSTTLKTSPPTNEITTKPPTHLPTLSPLSFAKTEAVVQFVNRKTLSNGNPVRYFQIIVMPIKRGTDPGKSADKKYERIKRKYEDQVEGEPYITAEFSKVESRTTFTVGDGKYYSRSDATEAVTKYLNGKLTSNTQYAVFQRSFDKDGGYENEGFVIFTTKAKFPTAIVVSVVVVLFVLLILAGAFIVWRRTQHVTHNVTKTSSRNLQHGSTQEIMEMSANINNRYGRLL